MVEKLVVDVGNAPRSSHCRNIQLQKEISTKDYNMYRNFYLFLKC